MLGSFDYVATPLVVIDAASPSRTRHPCPPAPQHDQRDLGAEVINDLEGAPIERLDRHTVCHPRAIDLSEDCVDDLLRTSGCLGIIGVDLGLNVEADIFGNRCPLEKLAELQQPIPLGDLLIRELLQGLIAFDCGELLPGEAVYLCAHVGEGRLIFIHRIGVPALSGLESEIMPHHRHTVRGEYDVQLQSGYTELDRVLVCGPRGFGEFTASTPVRLQVENVLRTHRRRSPLGLARLGFSAAWVAPGHRERKQRNTTPSAQRPRANLSTQVFSSLSAKASYHHTIIMDIWLARSQRRGSARPAQSSDYGPAERS